MIIWNEASQPSGDKEGVRVVSLRNQSNQSKTSTGAASRDELQHAFLLQTHPGSLAIDKRCCLSSSNRRHRPPVLTVLAYGFTGGILICSPPFYATAAVGGPNSSNRFYGLFAMFFGPMFCTSRLKITPNINREQNRSPHMTASAKLTRCPTSGF